MKVHLITHTHEPLKAIAAAILNIGIGRDTTHLDQITEEEAVKNFLDTTMSFLTSPLEFASFKFFWEDIPVFMTHELERARVGWSYAERSLRFYDASQKNAVDLFIDSLDDMAPSVSKARMITAYRDMLNTEFIWYQHLQDNGVDRQDARNVIGKWYPTSLQTATTFRALRDTMALRMSSQAHPAWKKAALQIKAQVTEVDETLGNALTDICDIQGRCVWQSKLDRPCDDCAERGRVSNHTHDFSRGQCTC